jgi:hypothetical protein
VSLATGADLEEDIPPFILGDSAYRNTCHFVTTYKVTECDADPAIRRLNFHLSKARYVVEHAFGILKGRFQIFEKPLRCAAEDLPFSVHLIVSIMVMHNFLIDTRDPFRENDVLPREIADGLQAVREGGDNDALAARIISEDDSRDTVEEQGGGNAEQEATREKFVRRMRWLDGDFE